jgi:hypothetical protein
MVVNDENRWINMEATTINCQLYRIYGWVKREQRAAHKIKDGNGEVAIKNEDTGEILNLIKDTDTPTPIQNGFLVSAFRYCLSCEWIESNTWVRRNTRFISSVEHDISRVSAANE